MFVYIFLIFSSFHLHNFAFSQMSNVVEVTNGESLSSSATPSQEPAKIVINVAGRSIKLEKDALVKMLKCYHSLIEDKEFQKLERVSNLDRMKKSSLFGEALVEAFEPFDIRAICALHGADLTESFGGHRDSGMAAAQHLPSIVENRIEALSQQVGGFFECTKESMERAEADLDLQIGRTRAELMEQINISMSELMEEVEISRRALIKEVRAARRTLTKELKITIGALIKEVTATRRALITEARIARSGVIGIMQALQEDTSVAFKQFRSLCATIEYTIKLSTPVALVFAGAYLFHQFNLYYSCISSLLMVTGFLYQNYGRIAVSAGQMVAGTSGLNSITAQESVRQIAGRPSSGSLVEAENSNNASHRLGVGLQSAQNFAERLREKVAHSRPYELARNNTLALPAVSAVLIIGDVAYLHSLYNLASIISCIALVCSLGFVRSLRLNGLTLDNYIDNFLVPA
jgi:hypothetical protein